MNKEIKVLIVGDGANSIYEDAMVNAFRNLGYRNTSFFQYEKYLKNREKSKISFFERFWYKIQNKYSSGPGVDLLNKKLLLICRNDKPDIVFLYRCRAVYEKTVKKIKAIGSVVFMYNNDDPFGKYYPKYFWRHYKRGLQYCDVSFVYREKNITDNYSLGVKRVELLRSYYIEENNFPLNIERDNSGIPEVLFLGHYENDGRKEYIEAIAEANISIGVPENWRQWKWKSNKVIFLKDTGKKYNELLNKTKIALVFLSQINCDTYTRRCFEIPATKTLMLSIYTDDLASMFEPDKEAIYFNTKEELIEKVKYYLTHKEMRERIGQAGYERLMQDGHEVKNRVLQIIKTYEELEMRKEKQK